jgi:hypothetical protein
MSEQQLNKDMQPDPLSPLEREAFYIGWQPKAPVSFAKHAKKVLLILFPVALLAGYLLSASQKKFSTANFEFGKLTEVKGIYFNEPVPLLKITDNKGGYITIPLVGYGKHGAETALLDYEKANTISLNKKELTLKGTLLYSDGKTLMQIDKNENPVIKVADYIGDLSKDPLPAGGKDLGWASIRGEIIDPKCFFGVMKPGEGKVHKDCAIRCILGGIPPVLKVQNEKGENNYYLIVGPNGEKMNEAVKNFVAEPVEIQARVVQHDDWIILYARKEKIERISYAKLQNADAEVIACAANCIK